MATLKVGGRTVNVGEDFMTLSPEQQDATVEEIARSLGTLGQEPKGLLHPFSSYPQTYDEMRRESGEQLERGIAKLGQIPEPPGKRVGPFPSPGAKLDAAVTDTLLGGTGYLTSPINAAARSIVGEPVEQAIGIPKELTEAAVTMAVPVKAPPRTPKVSAPSTRTLLEIGGSGYDDFRALGGSYSPETTNALADYIAAKLRQKGAYEHLDGMGNVYGTINLLRGEKPTSLDEFRSYLEALNTIRADAAGDKVGRAASIALGEMRQFLGRTEPSAAAVLERADANYAAGKRAERLDQAGEIAGLRTGRAGYGGNAVNNYRQVLSPIVEKAIKGDRQGFSVEEIQAMRDIVEGSAATNTARVVGQLSPTKGPIATGFAFGTAGTSAAVGAAANKLAAFLTSKQIDRLSELVRKRSPAYQEAVENASSKFFSAADDFAGSPTQANFIKTIVASRSLANGLTRDGIPMSSGKLLEYLQSPGRGAADENEQGIPWPPTE